MASGVTTRFIHIKITCTKATHSYKEGSKMKFVILLLLLFLDVLHGVAAFGRTTGSNSRNCKRSLLLHRNTFQNSEGFDENKEIANLKLELEDTRSQLAALVSFSNKQRTLSPVKSEGVDKWLDFYDNMDTVTFQLMTALQVKETILLGKLDKAKSTAELASERTAEPIATRSTTINWLRGSIADMDIPENLESLQEGYTIDVDLAYSGLTTRLGKQKVYLRRACVDLWEFLSRRDANVFLVSGCPGVGKSVEVFTYSMWQAKYCQQRVLYIHGKESDGFFFIHKGDRENDEILTCRVAKFLKVDTEVLLDIIDSFLEHAEVDLIVLDGWLGELIRNVFFLMKDYPSVRLISCTSFQAIGKISDEDYSRSRPFIEFNMDSWTKSEYEAAIKEKALNLHPSVGSLEEIFFYSGGSVRHIQDPVDETVARLNFQCRRSHDINAILEMSTVGDASSNAINSLMAIYGDQSFLVSQYVARRLMDKVSDKMAIKMRRFAADNPSWHGWVTELEVMALVRKRNYIHFRDVKGQTETWKSEHSTATLKVFHDASTPCLNSTAVLEWFQPLRWDQECFDAFFKVSNDELRVVQMTNTEKHSCKLEYLIPFVKAMNIHVVDFVFICRRYNFDSFVVPNPKVVRVRSFEAIEENNQYKSLLEALNEVQGNKTTKNCPPASITFRKLCYQKKDSDTPLDDTDLA